ncbi:adenine nucleotide alpha hydrolase family protein [Actinokineospora iranica]|uniref:3'-phosphoadenosine 5'-phosphosulfate sulfotransferase (PAPS reductase)/FAD synthetase n=1 Tax=Actinokineospora iranica TaxID=1271860 RepID=A0A1G6K3L3_9PSEU|nr:hypothetical protein [Actinokineospora iranica]SDC25468.1 3'-phosphoadenosine 5'-phosphosulfate sulfotransferase (PAPS reductase)/FAD synthetase [Actinokineospora iranica]
MPITIDGITPSQQIREQLAAEGKPVLLGFSRGKDSLAAWLAMREAGITVVPYHLYLVPGMRFVDEGLKFYEDFFDTRIVNLPHPTLYRWLNNFVFQPPHRCAIIEAAQLPVPNYEDMAQLVREDFDLPQAWNADGVRAADSPHRRMAMVTHGPSREHLRRVSIVWDWRIADVRAALARHRCPLPPDYQWFGRSFDGLDYRFIKPLMDHAPDDYARLLEWFPLADLEMFRRDLTP